MTRTQLVAVVAEKQSKETAVAAEGANT